MVKIWNEQKLDVNSSKKKKKRKVNKPVKVHSWHEQLPSRIVSEVWIKQSPADVKTISGRLGIPRLTVPTLRNLRIEGTGTQKSICAFGRLFIWNL